MTALAGIRGRPWLPRAAAWRRLAGNHPEWWVGPLIGLVWTVLVAAAAARELTGSSVVERPLSTWFVCPIVVKGTAPEGVVPLVVDLVGRTLMVVAMMTWLLVPTLHRVGLTGPWARRRRGPLLVLASYVVVWVAVTTGLDLAVGTVVAVMGPVIAVSLAVVAAAIWQLAPSRWRAIGRCARTVPLASRGRRADSDCIRFGVLIARACVVSCAGYMLLVAATGHSLLAMVAFAAVPLRERIVRPRRPVIGMLAVVVVGLVAIAGALGIVPP